MFAMEEIDDQEEYLSLSLGLVTNSSYKRKRITNTEETTPNHSDSSESYEEDKIFSLFHTRDQMLKLDHKTKDELSDHHEDGKGLHLIHLLLLSATAVNDNDLISAVENLCELYQTVSLTGDSVQRVAFFFADGLVARLLTRKSPFYDMIMKGPTPEEELLAFTELYKVSPFYQFAHFTANQAILEAFEKDQENTNNRVLHVIDFDISYGFQWPSLMQSLSEKATTANRIFLKITGFGRNFQQLQETESRLVSFAKCYRNLVFEFDGIVKGSKLVMKTFKKKNETIAANLVFHLNTLNSYSEISETLNYVYSLSPSIVVLVEQEGSRKTRNFLSRFMESLHYFAAIFDSLDDCLPVDSGERLSIEKNHLGKEIKGVINYDKDGENCVRLEKMETWKGRMERHGFLGIRQSCNSVMQAKLLLKIRSHCCSSVHFDGEDNNGGFRVVERDDGKLISLGWQHRFLITASSWQCV
ncbi:hypothetical protein DH2020_007805 [Rehmannia glutinosa]|uniref:Uncharacterized protein n=1 Tax=Rehmannia glutinosa TaxID=99300 RepID=A0ABR0TZ66_REHGL